MVKRFNIRNSFEELVVEAAVQPVEVTDVTQTDAVVSSDDDAKGNDPDLPAVEQPETPDVVLPELPAIAEVEPSEEAPLIGTAEFGEEERESDQLVGDVKEALDSATALETICENVVKSKDRGGLTPAGAALTMESIKNIAMHVGMKLPARPVIAVEAFTTVSQRQRNTEVALEAMEDILGRITDSVVKAFASFAKRIRRFMDSFIFSLRFAQGQLNAAYKSLSQAGQVAPSVVGHFTNKTAIANLTIDGKFNMDKCLEFSAKLATSMPTNVLHKIHEIEAFVRIVANDKRDVESIKSLKVPSFNPTEYLPLSFKVSKDHSGEYATYENSTSLPRNLSIALTAPLPKAYESDKTSVHSSSSTRFSYDAGVFPSSVEFMELNKVKIGLDKCQVILKNYWHFVDALDSICGRVVVLADSVTKIKPLITNVKDANGKDIIPSVIVDSANQTHTSIQKYRYRVAIAAVSALMENYYTLVQRPVDKLYTAGYETVEASIKYLYQSTKPNLYSKS